MSFDPVSVTSDSTSSFSWIGNIFPALSNYLRTVSHYISGPCNSIGVFFGVYEFYSAYCDEENNYQCYQFKAITDIQPAKILDDAVILIGDGLIRTAYFIRNQQLVKMNSQDVTVSYLLSSADKQFLNSQPTGKLSRDNRLFLNQLIRNIIIDAELSEGHRIAKLLVTGISSTFNLLYTIGTFIEKLFSNMVLGFITLATYSCSLLYSVYMAYQTQQSIQNQTEQMLECHREKAEIESYLKDSSIVKNSKEMHASSKLIAHLTEAIKLYRDKLQRQSEKYFRRKVEIIYRLVAILTSSLFILGLFFHPLFYVGMSLLIPSTLLQLYDNRSNLQFSRWLSQSELSAEQNQQGENVSFETSTQKLLRNFPDRSLSQPNANMRAPQDALDNMHPLSHDDSVEDIVEETKESVYRYR